MPIQGWVLFKPKENLSEGGINPRLVEKILLKSVHDLVDIGLFCREVFSFIKYLQVAAH